MMENFAILDVVFVIFELNIEKRKSALQEDYQVFTVVQVHLKAKFVQHSYLKKKFCLIRI